jgi:hypothetical protein
MKESCLSALGFPERVERYREVQQAREKWGRGVRHGWERQREITLHLIYLIVPKGIDKSVNLAHAWCFANTVTGFLGFKMIYLHILGPK